MKKKIVYVFSAEHPCETDMNYAKKSHIQEINKDICVIKTLNKASKSQKKEIPNVSRKLETTFDPLKSVKTHWHQ